MMVIYIYVAVNLIESNRKYVHTQKNTNMTKENQQTK